MLKHLFVAFNIIVYGVYIDVGKKNMWSSLR